ncbi:tRNA uridine-5-carboxymethylaminomethyl(34) synthesis GTPase MnmE [Helicobacter sp. MIT 01-3238]|uniref:tRNA uridine-5-carboxymethylaminomethyl(34) synthesis GTPase MnmE n=1 Tax=Helicobacter sp. MIT 01-3238 TaxID=398627 RepID=UPI000E1F8048|nr:tRNA uridine-5-carboxymethylaminomethyl(34) synthesis GTPase MnmE [Helicobacter sp. MIT 01-3238]RDU52119.1 tRNA uridine-5-carboxymethylaminomethyl(34) synthesis GTPase MnmE [Helicobacter sp. MIT 01-3238]
MPIKQESSPHLSPQHISSDTQDTIVAISTPNIVASRLDSGGEGGVSSSGAGSAVGGGIAIVRLSGTQALKIASLIAVPIKNNTSNPSYKNPSNQIINQEVNQKTNQESSKDKNQIPTQNPSATQAKDTNTTQAKSKIDSIDLSPRHATLCNVYDKGGILLDEAIIIYYKAPHSYTCEDVIEVHCHASDIIAQKVLQSCLHYGARLARGGEFTKRAFLNGRIDLSQANAIAQMIATKDAYLQSALISQLKGSLGDFVREVREVLYFTLASAEVMIDYSEEDIPSELISDIHTKLESLRIRLAKIYDFSTTRAKIGNAWKLAIIGKPNVGKSSLLNAILLQERAITSSIAGTTRDRIEEEIIIDGSIVRLIDTAGIRTSTDMIESKGIQLSLQALQEANIVLAIFDSSRLLDSEDTQVLDALSKNKKDKKILAIFNKSDCKNVLKSQDIKHIENLCDESLAISALDVERTAHTLQEKLKEIITKSNLNGEVILSASYQLESLKASIANLDLALQRLDTSELELFAYHIKDTLESIGQITSPYTNEEMLDKMFSQFCLGK